MVSFKLISKYTAFAYILLLVNIPLSHCQEVTPNPTFDCTNPNYRVVYTACAAGDYSKCCSVDAQCCGGGCCSLLTSCLNVGTPNEVCCDINDPNFCGYGTGTSAPFAVQSVVCEGSDGLSSYLCPPGATCEVSNDGCFGGSSGGSGGSSSSIQSPSSTSTSTSTSSSNSPAGASSSSVAAAASSSLSSSASSSSDDTVFSSSEEDTTTSSRTQSRSTSIVFPSTSSQSVATLTAPTETPATVTVNPSSTSSSSGTGSRKDIEHNGLWLSILAFGQFVFGFL